MYKIDDYNTYEYFRNDTAMMVMAELVVSDRNATLEENAKYAVKAAQALVKEISRLDVEEREKS